MSFRYFTICLGILAMAAAPVFGQTSGRAPAKKQADAAAPAPAASPAEQEFYNEGKSLEEAGNLEQAVVVYKAFIKKYPASPLASVAQYRVAQSLERSGQLSKAFDAYQSLVTRYPNTSEFEKAVAEQIIIANKFLAGEKLSFLGFKIVPGTERAEEMFSSILKNAPFSKNAPVAQFNLGLTYEKQGKLKEATAAYQKILDKYPGSAIAVDAQYQMGYIYMIASKSGHSQDLAGLITAKNSFEDFLLQYNSSEKSAQAKDDLNAINAKESRDLLDIAKFYDRYKDFKAAVIYYNDVIRRSPKGKEADYSRERIQLLRSEVGDDALRSGPDKAETGEKATQRRRLQAQIETSALPNFNGPSKKDIVPDELPVVTKPKFRTDVRDVRPMPALEPSLPSQ